MPIEREIDVAIAADSEIIEPASLARVSWGAIFAGAVIAVALTALLSLLGAGIGLGSLDLAEGDGVSGAPKATLVWWAVTSILATGIGAFVAARLAGIPRGMTGALHGLAVWSVTTLLTLWLATSAAGMVLGAASSVVNTTARVTSGAVTTVGGAAIQLGGAVAPSPSQEDVTAARTRVQEEANRLLGRAGVDEGNLDRARDAVGTAAENIAMSPGSANQEIDRLINRLFEGPNAALSAQERDALVTAMANRAGLSREQADEVANRWQAQADTAWSNVRTTGSDVATQAGDTAVNVADSAADMLSKAAWAMFLISLAGLVAALIGSAIGGATLGLGLALAGAHAARGHEGHRVIGDDGHEHRGDEGQVRPRT